MSLEETGFCWGCGREIKSGLFCPAPKKCKDKYYRDQERQIKKSKKDGYGLAGSTH